MIGNNYRITLSGSVGSGKSSIGKLLSQQLQTDFISVGDLSRKKALSLGMDIDSFQQYLKNKPEMDKELDEYISNTMQQKSSFVLDYRLGFHFVKNAFHVLLCVSDDVAFKRISTRVANNENYNQLTNTEALAKLKHRNKIMQERFLNVYGVDFLNQNNYQLVISTNNLKPDEISELIIANYKKQKSG